MSGRLCLVSMLVILAVGTAQAQQTKVEALSSKQLLKTGDLKKAERSYQESLKGLTQETDQLQATVTWAQSLSRAGRLAKDDADKKALELRAIDAYQKALPAAAADVAQRRVIQNNLGTLLLRSGETAQALTVLKSAEADFAEASGSERGRYFYNLGRANELTGQFVEALAGYQQAALYDPTFTPASRAALRLLDRQEPDDKQARLTQRWLDSVVKRSDLTLAVNALRTLLSRPDWLKAMPRLPVSTMRYFTAARVDLATFEDAWSGRLEEARFEPSRAGEGLALLDEAYRGNWEIGFEPDTGLNEFSPLMTGDTGRREVSLFLKTVGDGLSDPEAALARYARAWTIDTTNSEAAVLAAVFLTQYRTQIPGASDYLDQFIYYLFGEKGEAYLGEDWSSILRFHTILGTIYAQQQDWGSSWDARSAIFQFEHAIEAHRRLVERKDPAAGRIATIHAELARAYEGVGQSDAAARTYVAALKDAAREDDHTTAREILVDIRNSSGLTFSDAEKRRIRAIKNRMGL